MRRARSIGLGILIGVGLLVVAARPGESAPTTEFTVTGDVVAPATYTLSTLQPLPAAMETVTFQTGGGPQTGTFTGPTLWSLLSTVGLQTPAVKNGVLRQYVVATGSDGYSALFSLGELAPQFGGTNPQDLVSYQQDGAPLGSTGFARIVAAKDNFGGAMSPIWQICRSGPPRHCRRRAAERPPSSSFPEASKHLACTHCRPLKPCRRRWRP